MAHHRRSVRTRDAQGRFLDALTDGATIAAACATAGIGRRTAYDWRKAEPAFAAAWTEALDIGTSALEDEAVRRAVVGVDEPVFYRGEVCGTVTKKSDTMLIFVLRRRRPEIYGHLDKPTKPSATPITHTERAARIEATLNRVTPPLEAH